jgi:RNA polymerase sigma factor (sigma-70 family)
MNETGDSHQFALIESAQLGDPVALDQLLRISQPDIRKYARRHCIASDVDDAVQESLLILTKQVRSLKAAAAFAGWISTIVRRECHRIARRMSFQNSIEDIAESELAKQTDDAVKLDLIAALESLPAHYLEVILLRDFAELTIAEIASRLNMEIPGVKSRLHRARELVREYLLTSD